MNSVGYVSMPDRYNLTNPLDLCRNEYTKAVAVYNGERSKIAAKLKSLQEKITTLKDQLSQLKKGEPGRESVNFNEELQRVKKAFQKALKIPPYIREVNQILVSANTSLRLLREAPTYGRSVDLSQVSEYEQTLEQHADSVRSILCSVEVEIPYLHSHATNYIHFLKEGREVSLLYWGLQNTTDLYSLYTASQSDSEALNSVP